MNRFVTLMKREWLQHRIGWLVMMGLPSLIMLGLVLIDGSGVHVQVVDGSNDLPPLAMLPVPLQTLGWVLATVVLASVFSAFSVMGQLPSLARRDIQDRSIEFWRSLPVSDAQAVGASVLMNVLALPAMAMLVAALGAVVVGALAVSLQHGFNAWLTQAWWTVLPGMLLLLLRMLLGLVLTLAWLSPLLMLTMAACAWLKRWGIPVVALGAVLSVRFVDAYLPAPVFGPIFSRLTNEALNASVAMHSLRGVHFETPADMQAALPNLPGAVLADAGHVLSRAASPAMAAALAVAALCFWLVVLRRKTH